MGARPPLAHDSAAAQLFKQLIEALHAESDALVANDGAGIASAASRKQALLDALAPQARALRNAGDADLSALALEAARLNAMNSDFLNTRQNVVRGRVDALLQAASAAAVYGADGSLQGKPR